MGTWGAGTFESDVAIDFINDEIDRHVRTIESLFADDQRFRLDEDAEGELIPSVVILTFLCEHCAGVFEEHVDIAAWKTRYLRMCDDQKDELEPALGLKEQRRAVIEGTFDALIKASGKP